ncbi:MAG: hypothetical protein II348_06465 [Clostridia bacterium]|nr:hypothetical protein [Clostridia bacterium]
MKFFKLTLCLILLSVMVLGIVACSEPATQGPTDTGSSDVQHEQTDLPTRFCLPRLRNTTIL